MDDHELLREYVERRSQDAFRELVERHLRMVYSAACRMVRDSHLAEEVAQGVFTTLAQKAGSLGRSQVVGGWLYNTTRHHAMHAVRTEQRRREREQTAVAMQSLVTEPDAHRIAEQLEPAMDQLEAGDRDVLVLRYLEDRTLREVGAELGISEDAARMRVNRALEQLRSLFAHQGIHLTTALLASALVATTVSAVPTSLSAAILATASVTAAATAATHAVITTMNWINAKTITAVVAAAVIAGTSTYLVQQQEVKSLRAGNEDLVAQQKKLTAENEAFAAAAQAHAAEAEQSRREKTELLRLRKVVSQLPKAGGAGRSSTQVLTPAKPANPARPNYISKDRVEFAGYSTPEAAFRSVAWATFNGTPEQKSEGLSPQLLANAEAYKMFEENRTQGAAVLKGVEILAKKTLNDNEVELKLLMDTEPIPGRPPEEIPTTVLSMVKVGNEWKVGTKTRDYHEDWDNEGNVEVLGQ